MVRFNSPRFTGAFLLSGACQKVLGYNKDKSMFELFSLFLIILGLSVLIIIHELGHFCAARYFGLLIEEFGFGLPPKMFGKRWGETLVSLNWLPFGGFVRIYGERHDDEKSGIPPTRSFAHQSVLKKSLIMAAGVLMNVILGWFLISVVFMVGIPQSVLITEVQENTLAEVAGLLAGDQLLGFKTIDGFIGFVEENKGMEISLEINRVGETLTVPITPRIEVPEGEGNLGIAIVETGLPQTGFFQSFWEGLKTSIFLIGAIFAAIARLAVGVFTDLKILEGFVGPVGIVNVAIQTTKLGLVHFLQLVALISLNLAVFNVLPIPALDGGRLFFLLIGKLKGSPIKPQTEAMANALGFALLIFLIFAVTIKDILTIL